MPVFSTQRFANNFPLSTRLRRDPSSLGQRLFSVFAEMLDLESIENLRIKQDLWVHKRPLGVATIWSITLTGSDLMTRASTIGSGYNWNYPTTVTANSAAITLTRDEYMEDLLYGVATRISTKDTTSYTTLDIWSSTAASTYNNIDVPERLWVIVENSTNYRDPAKDTAFGGSSLVRLEGKDENGLDIEEVIYVKDDATYLTKYVWSELTSVVYDGFDGTVSIKAAGISLPFEIDPFRAAVLDDMTGPLWLRLSTTGGSPGYPVLQYRSPRLKLGREYRATGSSFTGNEEYLSDQVLLDDSNANYTAVDFAISPEDARLYVLGDDARVHIYEHGFTPFSPSAEEPSKDTHVRIQPIVPYIGMNQSQMMLTWLDRISDEVAKVSIKRVTPSSTTEYLQSDLTTWSGSVYWFPGNLNTGLSASSWTDRFFSVTFTEFGQWDFIATTVTASGVTTTSVTSVMVDSLRALKSLSTGVTSPTGIYFNKNAELTIVNATTLTTHNLHRDTYVADPESQQLYFREQYTSVEVA